MTPLHHLLDYHSEGEGVLMASRLVRRMRVERVELPCTGIQFESKTQFNLAFEAWSKEELSLFASPRDRMTLE